MGTSELEAGSFSRSSRNVTIQPPNKVIGNRSKSVDRSKNNSSSGVSQYSETDNDDTYKDIGDASWLEVCTSCFIHTPKEWLVIFIAVVLILGCFYFFGLGIEMLGAGAQVMAGCQAVVLFSADMNPVAEVMIGVLVTVLMQSSSTTTSLIVGLVSNDILTVQQGIYMVMGANIGTTITNTIVSLGQMGNMEQYEKAFGGAIVHDIFNWLTVAVLLPLEVLTQYLYRLTQALVQGADPTDGDTWEGPAKKVIKPLEELILIPNKQIYHDVSQGGATCQDYYPIHCQDPQNPTYETCNQTGLIACNKKSGNCPAFFDVYATQAEDQASGFVVFCLGLAIIFISMFFLVRVLTYMLTGVSIRVIYKATDINGYLLIAIGCGITMMLQSSSTFTSFLVPLVGMGALRLEQTYALTVGANIGTTISALLAAMATDGTDGLQVALSHLMFNVSGAAIWFPIPFMRKIPVYLARNTARYARVWRVWPLLYIIFVFGVVPLGILGISALFESPKKGLEAVGIVLLVFVGIVFIILVWWCYYKRGNRKIYFRLKEKREIRLATETLTTDMDLAKLKIRHHQKCAGLPVSEEDFNDDADGHAESTQESPPDLDEIGLIIKRNQEAVRKAVRKLPKDMLFVQTALSMLDYHTGMKFDGGSDESGGVGGGSEGGSEDGNKGADDVEAGNQDSENPSPVRKGREKLEETSFVLLLKKVPTEYLVTLLIVIPFCIWGLVALYMDAGKAAVGAAGTLTIVFALLPLWALKLWLIEADRIKVIQYFHNLETREASIKKLPRDMVRIKGEIKELLRHYKLSLTESLLVTQTSSIPTSSHDDSAQSTSSAS